MDKQNEQLSDLIAQINEWDARHREMLNYYQQALRVYLTDTGGRGVVKAYQKALAMYRPYSQERERLKAAVYALLQQPVPHVGTNSATYDLEQRTATGAESRYPEHTSEFEGLTEHILAPSAPQPHHSSKQRLFTFTCVVCGRLVTRLQYPGTVPHRCAECTTVYQRERRAAYVRRKRAAEQAARSGSSSEGQHKP